MGINCNNSKLLVATNVAGVKALQLKIVLCGSEQIAEISLAFYSRYSCAFHFYGCGIPDKWWLDFSGNCRQWHSTTVDNDMKVLSRNSI